MVRSLVSQARRTVLGASLVLVGVTPSIAGGGWYLMYPPVDPPPKDGRSIVPLRDWTTLGSFDSANECEVMRHVGTRMAELNIVRSMENPVRPEQMSASLCIASDDRRLHQASDSRAPH